MIRGIRRVALVLCDRLDDARITVKTHVDHLLHDAAIDNDSGVIRLDLHFESCRCLGVAGEPLVFQDLVKRDALAWLDLEDAVKEILELWSERFRQDVAAVEHESMLLGETALRWKGQLADKHHIETHAKAPDVDFLAVGFAAKELGGRVRHASTVREKMLLASQVVAQAKIDDLDLAAKGEHQVFHFQVTVDNLILVQVLECMDELATVPASRGLGVCPSLLKVVKEIDLSAFRHKAEDFGPINDLEQLDDVAVVEALQNGLLAVHVADEVVFLDLALVENLDGNLLAGAKMAPKADNGKGATAKLVCQLIAANARNVLDAKLAWGRHGGCGVSVVGGGGWVVVKRWLMVRMLAENGSHRQIKGQSGEGGGKDFGGVLVGSRSTRRRRGSGVRQQKATERSSHWRAREKRRGNEGQERDRVEDRRRGGVVLEDQAKEGHDEIKEGKKKEKISTSERAQQAGDQAMQRTRSASRELPGS
eukprot:m.63193 g.63193  ORF g.63193 m.63193 type:complete len:479 (+) comp7443_c0_seq2:1511-2947(+)